MAVAKPITPLNVIEGSYKDKDRQVKRKLSTDTYAQERNGKIILEAKPKRTKKKTQKQEILHSRLTQMECMWKVLTKGQRMAFSAYANREGLTQNGNRRVYDVFKSLGMNYQLNDFLENFCNVKIGLIFEGITSKTVKLRAFFTQTEPIEVMLGDINGIRHVRG